MAQIGGANKGENGKTQNNILGNQRKLTGNKAYYDEVGITGWWNGDKKDKPLKIVARFKDPENRKRIVDAITNACQNPHIGYDNAYPNRQTLRRELLKLPGGITPDNFKKINNNCATDCSALVTLCIKAACGIDFGEDIFTGNYWTSSGGSLFYYYPNVFQTFTNISQRTKETGARLLPGDIVCWRNSERQVGHIAIVVNGDSSYDASQLNLGNWGVVIYDGEQVYGQTKSYTLEGTKGALNIAFMADGDLRYASKIVSVDDYGILRTIYDPNETFSINTFIGDNRVMFLGFNFFDENSIYYDKQLGLFPDKNIFASNYPSVWGVDKPLVELLSKASKNPTPQVFFWIGINDIISRRQDFTYYDSTTDQWYVNQTAIDYFVSCYKLMIAQYLYMVGGEQSFKRDENNRIFIVSIESTSTNYKYFYDLQGEVIDKINQALYDWTYQIFVQEGYENIDDCWIQFVYLDGKSGGHSSQSNVKNSYFLQDGLNFNSSWYKQRFLPMFDFDGFPGEEDGD